MAMRMIMPAVFLVLMTVHIIPPMITGLKVIIFPFPDTSN